MKAHICADVESGLVHGEDNAVCTDAGHSGVEKRPVGQIAFWRSTYK